MGQRGECLPDLAAIIRNALSSPAVRLQRAALKRKGMTIDPEPILSKVLDGNRLRLMFPVTGMPIAEETVAALVLLHDLEHGTTLYAHPIHAGSSPNPLVVHLDGPMSAPKAQEGADGERATRRLMEHKRALWSRFLNERKRLGEHEAGERWRKGFYWALRRLYFCSRCGSCKWGSPFFDGPCPDGPTIPTHRVPELPVHTLRDPQRRILDRVRSSDAWNVEVAYARRGEFNTSPHPRLFLSPGDGWHVLVFPTDARILQAGALVGLAAYFYEPDDELRYAHCLIGGPEPQKPLIYGEKTLGLPPPGNGEAGRIEYQQSCLRGWHQFWLDELDDGLIIASERWLDSFWQTLACFYSDALASSTRVS